MKVYMGYCRWILIALAFTLTESLVLRAQASHDVYLMNADGSNLHQVTHQEARIINRVRFSGDGSTLVFDSGDGTNSRLYTCSLDGAIIREVPNTSQATFPVFSHDGKKILFTAATGIFSINRDGSAKALIAASGYAGELSSEGSKLVFVKSGPNALTSQIFVSNADGSGVALVPTIGALSTFVGGPRPVFNPRTNSQIMFYSKNISRVNTDGTGQVTLLAHDILWDATYSSDGQFVVYGIQSPNSPDRADIYKMNADGTGAVRLTNSDGLVNFIEPSYSPDGKLIALVGITRRR